jgi:hypothetical protein
VLLSTTFGKLGASKFLNSLESAAKNIRADDTVDIEPVIDRDTRGVPGAPEIAKTIFQEVTTADAGSGRFNYRKTAEGQVKAKCERANRARLCLACIR